VALRDWQRVLRINWMLSGLNWASESDHRCCLARTEHAEEFRPCLPQFEPDSDKIGVHLIFKRQGNRKGLGAFLDFTFYWRLFDHKCGGLDIDSLTLALPLDFHLSFSSFPSPPCSLFLSIFSCSP
jgi:hypothetical protein